MKNAKAKVRTGVQIVFARLFIRGTLTGITHWDQITFTDTKAAAGWVRGIRRNSRAGKLDYKLSEIHVGQTVGGSL